MSANFRQVGVVLVTIAAVVATIVSASSATATSKSFFFEETAAAFWTAPHQCADGSTVPATLLVQTTRDFESPETEDPDPTARVQFLAVCPTVRPTRRGRIPPAAITSASNLKRVTARGQAW